MNDDMDPDAEASTGELGDLVHDELGRHAPRPLNAAADDPGDSLLDQLHRDYLLTLTDPLAGNAGQDWLLHAASGAGPLADAFDALGREADQAGLGLYDLVEAAPPIDDLLQVLAAERETSDLLEPEAVPGILHLLAPEHLRRQTGGMPGDGAALPLLTRKEHHELALDSALAGLFGGRAAAAPDPS